MEMSERLRGDEAVEFEAEGSPERTLQLDQNSLRSARSEMGVIK
jgi:hypothetical protein